MTDDEFQQQKTMLLAGGAGASATLIPAEKPGRRYRVIMVHPGETRWQLGKAFVASIPEFPSDGIAKMLQSLPAVILSDVGKSRAEAVQAALTAAGATVEIQ